MLALRNNGSELFESRGLWRMQYISSKITFGRTPQGYLLCETLESSIRYISNILSELQLLEKVPPQI